MAMAAGKGQNVKQQITPTVKQKAQVTYKQDVSVCYGSIKHSQPMNVHIFT